MKYIYNKYRVKFFVEFRVGDNICLLYMCNEDLN